MLEITLGLLVAWLYGGRHGWSLSASIPAGLLLGLALYVVSCAVWPYRPCWWPWCTTGKTKATGPGGKVYRRRRLCRVCGGKDYRRLGARMFDRQ